MKDSGFRVELQSRIRSEPELDKMYFLLCSSFTYRLLNIITFKIYGSAFVQYAG